MKPALINAKRGVQAEELLQMFLTDWNQLHSTCIQI